METGRKLALGIDLGGTHIKAGVVSSDGKMLGQAIRPTRADLGVQSVVLGVAQAAQAAMADAGVGPEHLQGAGVGAPGLCDHTAGVVVEAVNLGWQGVPAVALLQDALGLPVTLDNDANCAALGEQRCGAARGSNHVVLLALGTGIGGGLILDGRVYRGLRGWAGELGHMPAVEGGPLCRCGQRGCLETVASASAMGAAAQREIAAERAPGLARLAREQQAPVDARLVIRAAQAGDEPALAILAEAGRHLGRAVAGLVNALNPEIVLVGGGAASAGDLLLEPLREMVAQRAMPAPAAAVRILPALLGNEAGTIGAGLIVFTGIFHK